MKRTLILAGLLLVLLCGCSVGESNAVLADGPENFLCRAADLPAEGGYYAPNDTGLFQTSNASLLAGGVQADADYIEATGRLDGWVVQYGRQEQAANLPGTIVCSVVSYDSAAGARLSVREYNAAARGEEGWEKTGERLRLGDVDVVLVYRSPNTGELRTWKVIEFAYRNMVVDIGALGLEGTIDLQLLEGIGQAVLARLEAASLETPVP